MGYASVQPPLSAATGRLPFAVLDVVLLVAAGSVIVGAVRGPAGTRLRRAMLWLVLVASVGWLGFLVAWGWHYQVPTLEARLRITADELTAARGAALVRAMVAQLDATHAEAHAAGWPEVRALPAVIGPALGPALRDVGVAWTPAWPRPKRSALDWYFRAAGIDGMTNPFGLDVILNSRVLPFERPALLAHEYAHLAGFADESDASVVAWLACQQGSAGLRYSSALAVLPHLLSGLPSDERRRLLEPLGEGPRRDLRAIAARLDEQRPWIHALAWQTYDRFLKTNRVGEGVARYDAVARVLVAVGDPATGRLRRAPQPWPHH